MAELVFFVSGVPVAKGRARIVRPKERGAKAHAFTPAKTEAWEARVRFVAMLEARRRGWVANVEPCEVEITLSGLSVRSDIDNAAKAILDALNGVAWDDDRRVWSLLVRRDELLAIGGRPSGPGARVVVRREPSTVGA